MHWKSRLATAALTVGLAGAGASSIAQGTDVVRVSEGALQGTGLSVQGVRRFLGVPFAQPPVGDLRWRAPQPVSPWRGVRMATQFGDRCTQAPLAYPDLVTRAPALSEDCLYLNVWTPSKAATERLPVLVYLYGGGFTAGDSSEPRYDGASMAARGIVVVTLNYRLGVFGFLATPELSRESGWRGSGDWGLLDQIAALKWVKRNIAAFGGDPDRITIGGESAGSISVSALMASPLSRGMIAGAIGESGSIMGSLNAASMLEAETIGTTFMAGLGGSNLTALRAIPADRLYAATSGLGAQRFPLTIDGHVLPKPVAAIYDAGEQAHVPLLAGSNSQEMPARAVLGNDLPTVENYRKALSRLYGDEASSAYDAYPASADGEPVLDAAQALASDRFIAFSTWRWMDAASRTGGKPTYYFSYARPRPPLVSSQSAAKTSTPPWALPARGAVHSAEIEYALGNLDGGPIRAWTVDDRVVSATMQDYFANFIKTGNPNGEGLRSWSTYLQGGRMQIDVVSTLRDNAPDKARYRFMADLYNATIK